jgi:DNA polymerase-3 subunit delta
MAVLKGPEIERFVARPDPARPVALVCGADAGLVSERAEAIVRASVDDPRDPFSVITLAGDELASDPARLLDEAQAIPMFGGRRAIRVRAGARSFMPALEALLAETITDCRIVIEAGDLKRTAPLRTVCERARNAAVIVCYPDTTQDLERLIDAELREAGLSIAPDARAALVPLLGGDRRASRNELRKLALFAHGGEQVTLDDVLGVIGDSSALAVDELVDAALAGRPRELETRYARAEAAGTASGTIVFTLLRQLSTLHKARLAIEAGSSTEREAEALRVHFRRKPALEAALRAWTSAGLARAIEAAGKAQFETRRQAALAATLTQRALMSLAIAARRKE